MWLPTWVEMHGALTHFPIALLIMAVVYEFGAAIWRKAEWRIVSFWLLVGAVVLSVPALFTGWMTGLPDMRSGHPSQAFIWHRLSAFLTSGLSCLILTWRAKAHDRLDRGALAASMGAIAGASVIVLYTGYLGGEMALGGNGGGTVMAQSVPTPATAAGTPVAPVTSTSGPPRVHGQNADPQLVAAGEKIFRNEDNGCLGCHKMNGEGRAKGPDLTHEGRVNADLDWQIAHLKNPAKMKPGSTMPGYEDMKPQDLKALATYLITRQ